MNLLLDFLCRFGWGMAAGLVLTPAALVPGGFFRVNLLVVLGLATTASLVSQSLADAGGIWIPTAAAAVVAWIGSVAWLAGRTRAGQWSCGIAGVLLAGATVVTAAMTAGVAGDTAGAAWLAGGEALVSGLVAGLTVHAMLLGHWYLNAPGMRVDALRRMIDLALAAWALQMVVSVAGLVNRAGFPTDLTGTALLSLRWIAGLAGLPLLLVMARKTLEIPNTQSATGILYVACLAAILGELTSQLLQAAS
jgi:hypothetical protein